MGEKKKKLGSELWKANGSLKKEKERKKESEKHLGHKRADDLFLETCRRPENMLFLPGLWPRTLRKRSVAIHVEAARGDTFLRGDVNIWRLVFVSLITRAGAPEGAVHGRLGRSRCDSKSSFVRLDSFE